MLKGRVYASSQPGAALPCPSNAASRLRDALSRGRAQRRCILVPACYDALSAKLIQQHGGFEAAFMSGYGVSAARLGQPDAGIITYSEMVDTGRNCCAAAPNIPIIGDGDTGFGAVQNVFRAVSGYAAAGFAAITIEDQTFPKRCSFSTGMRCVSREEATMRMKAALAAAKECYLSTGHEIIVVGRTDVRNDRAYNNPFSEALSRAKAFEDLGCEIVYFEGPNSLDEMEKFNASITGAATMLAQVEKPGRRLLTPSECSQAGYDLCLHGLTLLSASIRASEAVLDQLARGQPPSADSGLLCDFDHLYSTVGFGKLIDLEDRF